MLTGASAPMKHAAASTGIRSGSRRCVRVISEPRQAHVEDRRFPACDLDRGHEWIVAVLADLDTVRARRQVHDRALGAGRTTPWLAIDQDLDVRPLFSIAMSSRHDVSTRCHVTGLPHIARSRSKSTTPDDGGRVDVRVNAPSAGFRQSQIQHDSDDVSRRAGCGRGRRAWPSTPGTRSPATR